MSKDELWKNLGWSFKDNCITSCHLVLPITQSENVYERVIMYNYGFSSIPKSASLVYLGNIKGNSWPEEKSLNNLGNIKQTTPNIALQNEPCRH